MTVYKEVILDTETQKVTKIEFTPEELANKELKEAELIKEQEHLFQQEKEKQALRESANSKLASLGLTPEEIAAITGA